ncbi:MAG: hypothetical protein QOD42_2114 [Sphingomonadales bacterium]|jgi:hypothetical protein|nr:hypothetical protein [Sphingomonadales bacterium]
MRLASLLAILAAFPLAAPAAAQIAGRPDYGGVPRMDRLGAVESRIPAPRVRNGRRDLRERIEEARGSGRISRSEARAYRREARAIGALGPALRPGRPVALGGDGAALPGAGAEQRFVPVDAVTPLSRESRSYKLRHL